MFFVGNNLLLGTEHTSLIDGVSFHPLTLLPLCLEPTTFDAAGTIFGYQVYPPTICAACLMCRAEILLDGSNINELSTTTTLRHHRAVMRH